MDTPAPSTRIGRWLATATTTAAAVALLAGPATAHVTVNPEESPAGFTKVSFRVPHGCESGAATETLRIQIPAGVASIKPEFLPGWEVTTTTGELPRPVQRHGEEITEGVTEVAFTGPPIPDDQFKEFGLSVFLDAQPGETLYFKAIQECVDGSQLAWIQTPGEGQTSDDLEEPAPALTITGGQDNPEGEALGEQVLSAVNLHPATAAAGGLILGLLGLLAGLAAAVRGLVRR